MLIVFMNSGKSGYLNRQTTAYEEASIAALFNITGTLLKQCIKKT